MTDQDNNQPVLSSSTVGPQLLTPLRQAVLDLSVEQEAVNVIFVRVAVKLVQERLREIAKLLDEQLIAWITENGDLVIDENTRLYVSTKKTTKCNNTGKCLIALEEAACGEIDKVMECLSANAIKPGAARSLLGAKWKDHFTEIVEKDVKTGQPIRTVAEVNKYTRLPNTSESVPKTRTVNTSKVTGNIDIRYVPRLVPSPSNMDTSETELRP